MYNLYIFRICSLLYFLCSHISFIHWKYITYNKIILDYYKTCKINGTRIFKRGYDYDI